MAYAGIDSWEVALAPALKARIGDPDPVAFDEDWTDEPTLSAWEDDVEGAGVEAGDLAPGQPKLLAPSPIRPEYEFELPTEPDPGRAQADRTAAMRGVNPGKQGGGAGHLFELARSFLGTPYVFGASGPGAFDCSGFVKYLFERVYGIELPHSAAQQSSFAKKVDREHLQPGDLIWYSYGRLGKGAIDHVEVYMGNGKQIGTSNTTEDLDIDNVDWDNVAVMGRIPGSGGAAVADLSAPGKSRKPGKSRPAAPPREDLTSVPARLTNTGGNELLGALSSILTDDVVAARKRKTPAFKGPQGSVKTQLYRGFMDAGREDLAKMVRTKDFATWIQQESGWQVDVTSPANNHGKANDGLFQVWRGHDYNANGQVSRMSPYEQATLVAKYFSHLTPEAIRSYAAAIRAGTYHGWG